MSKDKGESHASAGETSAAAASGVASTGAPGKLPRGLVLGKDGKPCRTCNSLAAFSSQTKSLKTVAAAPTIRKDCPPDVEELGRSTWTLLHSIAATYPKTPTTSEQDDLRGFFKFFAKLYPCWVCAEDFQQYMKKETMQTSSREDFGQWLCRAHNDVNKKLGKPTFDCAKWEERWRTGWRDGSCD